MNLLRAASTISLFTLASRITGLARDVVMASAFGAGASLDAFYVAFRIPNLLPMEIKSFSAIFKRKSHIAKSFTSFQASPLSAAAYIYLTLDFLYKTRALVIAMSRIW